MMKLVEVKNILMLFFHTLPSQKQGKTSGMAFCPPLRDPLLEWLLKRALPWIFSKGLNGFSVSVSPASLVILNRIKGERCLLLPNHPSQWDPWVLFELSKRLHESFYYVSAREVFDWHRGLQGFLLQRMGVYSVVRGASDKESFKTTKDILGHNKGRLVIFVEGEVSNQNDALLPLEPGVLQLAFLALHDLYKQNNKDLSQLPPLYVCPLALKYFYSSDGLHTALQKALSRLEKAVGLSSSETEGYFERIRNIGAQVLEDSSRQFGYPLPESGSLAEKVKGLEHFILTKMENVMNLPPDEKLSYLDRVRRVRNLLDKIIKDVPETLTAYQASLHEHQKEVLENFYVDLDRIVNFIAIFDGYAHPDMPPERAIEAIRRLEREVLGVFHFQHPRTAVLQVLEPIDLKPHFEAFLKDKKKVSESLMLQIEHAMYQAITTAVSET